jgi:hypothetical protein
MHPSERGKGKNWAQWKKGTYKPKPPSPYDFSKGRSIAFSQSASKLFDV